MLKTYGLDSTPTAAICLNALGDTYYRQRKYQEALSYYQQAYKLYLLASGEYTRASMTDLRWKLANTYIETGNDKLADSLLKLLLQAPATDEQRYAQYRLLLRVATKLNDCAAVQIYSSKMAKLKNRTKR